MLKTNTFAAAIAAAALLASTGASLAQYKGPPIIVQTPQTLPPANTDNLKPLTGVTLQAAPAAAAAPAATASTPAAAAAAKPCAAGTKC